MFVSCSYLLIYVVVCCRCSVLCGVCGLSLLFGGVFCRVLVVVRCSLFVVCCRVLFVVLSCLFGCWCLLFSML